MVLIPCILLTIIPVLVLIVVVLVPSAPSLAWMTRQPTEKEIESWIVDKPNVPCGVPGSNEEFIVKKRSDGRKHYQKHLNLPSSKSSGAPQEAGPSAPGPSSSSSAGLRGIVADEIAATAGPSASLGSSLSSPAACPVSALIPGTNMIRCPWCSKTFTNNSSQITRHLEGEHLGTLYNCPWECGHAPFTRVEKAKDHGLICEQRPRTIQAHPDENQDDSDDEGHDDSMTNDDDHGSE
ncbi:hypothetical protein C8T65DRAFT_827596 [Cerioporus squamosus]|nr:hypothetical protein C8T65DRAFT_827596 [Cerioporus squamosus]